MIRPKWSLKRLMVAIAVATVAFSLFVPVGKMRAIRNAEAHLRRVDPEFNFAAYPNVSAEPIDANWFITGRWHAGWRVSFRDLANRPRIDVDIGPNGEIRTRLYHK